MTAPTAGRKTGGWRRIPERARPSLSKCAETVKEIEVPVYVQVEKARPLPFNNISDDKLLAYGVPAEWLPDVRHVDEDGLLELADHLPTEAAEALLELATGGTPPFPGRVALDTDPFEHPDARRRFRVMHDVEELERGPGLPVGEVGGLPASGSAGDGRAGTTAVRPGYRVRRARARRSFALHRAVHLARVNPDARVLLTTFSETLAHALRRKLRILISAQPRLGERIEVYAIDALGERLYRLNVGGPAFAARAQIRGWIEDAATEIGESRFCAGFHADRVGAGRRRLAVGYVGGISRRPSSWPPPQSA